MLCYAVFCRAMLCPAVFCHALFCPAALCHALFCPVLSCSVLFFHALFFHALLCYVLLFEGVVSVCLSRARGGTTGTPGTIWGLAAAVCSMGVAWRSVLKI